MPVIMKKAKISKLENDYQDRRCGYTEWCLHMLEEFIFSTNIDKLSKSHLSYNGTELSARSGNTVACRTVTCGEHLSGYHECSSIWAKILEEVREAVEEHESLGGGRSRCECIKAEAYTHI